MKKTKRLLVAICLLIVSATLLGTASFAWFSMNTEVGVDGIQVEAYSDSLFLEISKDNTTYNTSVDFSSNGEVVLRLAKHGFVGDIYTLEITSAEGYYETPDAGAETPVYYKLVAATSDSFEKYVKAVLDVDYKLGTSLVGLYENLNFEKVLTSTKAVDGVDYYDLVAGKYVPVDVVVTVGSETDVKGYYKLTETPEALAEGNYGENNYNDEDQYYVVDEDGVFANITSTLELGTDLSVFYEIEETRIENATAVTGDVYIAGTGAVTDEYALLGTYPTDTTTDISDALYFGRAYSDVIADGDQTDTLNILKDLTAANGTYFYKETVFVRNALNTNDSKNLTATITVGGTENEIAKALRVLLVVTDVESGNRVNTVYYDNVDRESVYGQGENIIDVLLGNQQETLKVDIYVYFDGTDAVAQNSPAVDNEGNTVATGIQAGVLNGQTVSIAFNIDGHAYN